MEITSGQRTRSTSQSQAAQAAGDAAPATPAGATQAPKSSQVAVPVRQAASAQTTQETRAKVSAAAGQAQAQWQAKLDAASQQSATPVDDTEPGVVTTADPPQTQTNTPFLSQFSPGHGYKAGDTACFSAAVAMAKRAGAKVSDADQRIQVATGENKLGRVTVDKAAAQQGVAYIDGQLEAGKPVVVGVSHEKGKLNVDKLTDHFVVITGKGTDASGNTFYSFHDPGTRLPERGADTNANNRFYVDAETGNLYRPGAAAKGPVLQRAYDVTMVRPNL